VNGGPDEMATLVTIDGSRAESGCATTEIACRTRQSKAMVKVPEVMLSFVVDKVVVDRSGLLGRASESVCVMINFGFVCAMQYRPAEMISCFVSSCRATKCVEVDMRGSFAKYIYSFRMRKWLALCVHSTCNDLRCHDTMFWQRNTSTVIRNLKEISIDIEIGAALSILKVVKSGRCTTRLPESNKTGKLLSIITYA
jgi:hypothetical protein